MIPKFASELRYLDHTRFNNLVARSSLKFACKFQGRDTRAGFIWAESDLGFPTREQL